MSVNLITGYAGTAHITAAGDGAVNAGMFGSGKYVLNIGEKFDYEIISNNLIRVKSGYAISQGRKIELAVNDYEEIEIDNGLQGVKRCDLIVMRYEKSLTTGIETATMKVIKGISGDEYTDPTYTSGNILNGASEDDFLLYRVKINGLNIEAVEPLFTVTNSIFDLLNKKDEEISNLELAVDLLKKNDTEINERLVTTNANLTTALKANASNLTFSSETIFTALGAAPVSKAGKMGSLYTVFKVNSEIKAGNVIAAVPDGFTPKVDYKNIPILRVGDSTDVYTVNVLTTGAIAAGKTMPAGIYQLGLVYVTS